MSKSSPKKSSSPKSRAGQSKAGATPSVRISLPLLGGALLGLVGVILTLWWIVNRRPVFDGESAYTYLVKQCEFGARAPNSAGHKACKNFLVSELKKLCDRVSEQPFTYTDRRDTGLVFQAVNIVGSFKPEAQQRILLCAHWDTRPVADRDSLPANRTKPILGANDGASGVAALLEIARCLKQRAPAVGVDIVFFDLEDMGENRVAGSEDTSKTTPFCIGSEKFAEMNPVYRPIYGVLLDMIGDKDLRIPQEAISSINAPRLVEKVWKAASDVGATAFVKVRGDTVGDDHLPFLRRNIAVIDLIDFDYPYWHTLADTPDKCSAKSLEQVGRVLLHLLYTEPVP